MLRSVDALPPGSLILLWGRGKT